MRVNYASRIPLSWIADQGNLGSYRTCSGVVMQQIGNRLESLGLGEYTHRFAEKAHRRERPVRSD
jgi:hypothetical protein